MKIAYSARRSQLVDESRSSRGSRLDADQEVLQNGHERVGLVTGCQLDGRRGHPPEIHRYLPPIVRMARQRLACPGSSRADVTICVTQDGHANGGQPLGP
jgi:hypothetical protein